MSRRGRGKYKKTNIFLSILHWIIFAFIVICMLYLGMKTMLDHSFPQNNPGTSDSTNLSSGENAAADGEDSDNNSQLKVDSNEVIENKIYSFSQGPVAWNNKAEYSGEWCKEVLDGNLFSVFGCGLCAMSNVYSTLSPYNCSPVDMYYYAKETTDYSPVKGYGAIDWDYMEQALNTSGFYTCLCNKNPSLEEFAAALKLAKAAIVLVASYEDSTYWKDTSGHYVTIWLYDDTDGTVFLCDSGDPTHNRARIPLEYVYNALSTLSQHQYLLVYSYCEEDNQWKHDGILDYDWTSPW